MAHPVQFKLVLDTNVLVRGLANRDSSSGRLLRLCESRSVLMLLSRPVMLEYREVLARHELIQQHPAITADAVRLAIERLRYFADFVDRIRVRFRYDRDPDDACFIELAIAGAATHIITHDNDLRSLSNAHTDAGKRFRQRLSGVRVLGTGDFLREFEAFQHEA
ncbi:MAG: putative toxin-antitoxin system toxin component, PIN family [Tepidisphaeraceae bacterium]